MKRFLVAIAAVFALPALSLAGPVRDWIADHRPGILFAKPPAIWIIPESGCPCAPGQCPCVNAPGGKGTCGSYLCPANGGRPISPGVIVWPQQPNCPNGRCPIPPKP